MFTFGSNINIGPSAQYKKMQWLKCWNVYDEDMSQVVTSTVTSVSSVEEIVDSVIESAVAEGDIVEGLVEVAEQVVME